MSEEYNSYLIEKYHQPEAPERLSALSAPDSYEVRASETGRVVERGAISPMQKPSRLPAESISRQ